LVPSALNFNSKKKRVDKLANRSEQCLYVGHSDERVNTFLSYHREEGKVTEGGISKFDENIDEYGRLLRTFDSTYIHNFEVKSKRPEPYLDVEQNDLKIKSIFDADVYYDAEDNETYLVLRIMTLDKNLKRVFGSEHHLCLKTTVRAKPTCVFRSIMMICSANGSTTTKRKLSLCILFSRKYGVSSFSSSTNQNTTTAT
jgi:hypothetical protein